MNAEHEEAAAVDRLVSPKIAELVARGGVLLARKATVDDAGDLSLHYYVAMPIATNCVQLTLQVAPS